MSRLKLIMFCAFATCAMAAISSASASAAVCKHEGSTHGYCVEKTLLTEKLPVLGTSGLSILKSKAGGAAVEIDCKSDDFTGTIEPEGKSTATIKFLTCTLVKPENCTLTAAQKKEINTEPLSDKLILTSGRIEDLFIPTTGTIFATVNIEGPKPGTCVLAKEGQVEAFKVTGQDRCEADTSNKVAEEEKLTHELICKETGAELKFGIEKATFVSTASVMLNNDKLWSIGEI